MKFRNPFYGFAAAAFFAGSVILVAHSQVVNPASVLNGQATTAAPSYSNNTPNPLSLDLAGNTRVNCVTGCAAGSGSFNNNADNVSTSSTNGQAAAWPYVWNGAGWDRLYGDKTLGAFIQVKSSVLPTGAATAAKQPALGTAGTASPDVLTVQGIAAMTPLLATVTGTVAATQSGAWAVTANAGTNLNTSALALETGGNLATIAGAITSSVEQTNEKQINGVAPLMGNGVSGTGSQRINLASDNTAIAGWGQGATGSAVPSGAVYDGANVGGNLTGKISCGSSAFYDASTSGSTQLVALSAGKIIYICGYTILAAGSVNVDLRYGTASNCATGANKITPAFQLTAQAGVVDGSPEFRGLATIASNELCINASGAVAVQAIVYYTQF